MKSKVLAFFLLVFPVLTLAQDVTVSETFKKTVEKIAKKVIKEKVLHYLIKKDFMTGVVSTDLVGQIIDNYQDKERVISSSVNTISNLIFLSNLRPFVIKISDSVRTDSSFASSFKKADITNDDFISYSCLYIYFSERLKSNLYVSPYIYKYRDVQSKIESINVGHMKWITFLSGHISRAKNIIFDVRFIELFQVVVKDALANSKLSSQTMDTLLSSISQRSFRDSLFVKRVKESFEIGNPLMFLSDVVDKYIDRFHEDNGNYFIDRYYSPILTTISSPFYGYSDTNEIKDKVLQCIEALFTQWLQETENNKVQVEWVLSLSGTLLNNKEKSSADFTVLDQIRIAKHWCKSSAFIYVGGFIDPIIKNTVDKDGLRYYLAGAGFQYSQMFVSFTTGFPYVDFSSNDIRFGASIGYQIPLMELFH
jgi:hypothetical protein